MLLALALRAGGPVFLDRDGLAVSVTVTVTAFADPITMPVAVTVTIAIAERDPIGAEPHVGLSQRDEFVRSDGSAGKCRESRQAERRRKYQSKGFHEFLQFS